VCCGAPHNSTLGIVDFDAAMTLLQLGGYLMLAHVASTIGLRVLIGSGHPAFHRLFAPPLWGDFITPWQMQVRYFLPWVRSPGEVYRSTPFTIFLFWTARIAGALFVLAIVGFLGTVIYVGVHNA
jgi:hypothetical protein